MNVLLLGLLAAGLIATIKKIPEFIAYVRARHLNGIVTQALVWAIGVVAAFLTTAQSAVANLTATGGVNVQGWNGLTKALLGIGTASIASVLHDYMDKARQPRPIIPTATSSALVHPAKG
jgi:hypothetical protein